MQVEVTETDQYGNPYKGGTIVCVLQIGVCALEIMDLQLQWLPFVRKCYGIRRQATH